jgi:hypothetical protein
LRKVGASPRAEHLDAAIRLLDDLEATTDGAPLARILDRLNPAGITVDLGSSSLARAVHALPVIDAALRRFPRASVCVEADSPARELLEEHVGERLGDSGELVIDLRPGLRRSARFEPPRLFVPAAPYPWRSQHAFAHFADGAAVAGLCPDWTRPRLALTDSTRRSARRLVRELFGLRRPLVTILPGPSRFDFGGVLQALSERLGARELLLPPEVSPAVRAAGLGFAAVAVGEPRGWSDVAAAAGSPIVTLHGRDCPVRFGPASERGVALFARCRLPEQHRAPRSRDLRCLDCLAEERVVDAAERLAAERWPMDRLSRILP